MQARSANSHSKLGRRGSIKSEVLVVGSPKVGEILGATFRS